MLRNCPREFWAFIWWVRKNPTKFLADFPQNFPPKNQIKFTDELLQERREKHLQQNSLAIANAMAWCTQVQKSMLHEVPWKIGMLICHPATSRPLISRRKEAVFRENRMGGFREEGSCNGRFVLKPDVAIASDVSISSKDSLAITDFFAKRPSSPTIAESPLLDPPPMRDFQVLSPCNFATARLTACILKFHPPWTSQPMKWRTLSQRPSQRTQKHYRSDIHFSGINRY